MLTRRAKAYSSSCSQTVSLSPAISSQLLWGYRYLMPSCAGFIEPRKSRLGPSKFTFNAENFIAACACLSQLVSAQFAHEKLRLMCFATRNRQKIHKNPILAFKVIQGLETRVFQAADGKDLMIWACAVFDWSTRVTDGRTELRWLRGAESSSCFRA